ncbi:hypothetical protein MRB53_042371 [Persea americana]|nr:hypothetical protein MRB53_042371 [Persea americana]
MLRPSVAAATRAATGVSADALTFITGHSFPHLQPVSRFQMPTSLLEAPLRKDILHRAVIYERDGMRQGTASTKTRGEVSGSTRKVRPQKGSGQARLGDRTSPMLRGGGRAHGPKPRDFSTELPRKVYYMAIRNAISYLFKGNSLVVVDGEIDFPSHKTALAVHFLESHGFISEKAKTPLGGRTLFIVDDTREALEAVQTSNHRKIRP